MFGRQKDYSKICFEKKRDLKRIAVLSHTLMGKKEKKNKRHYRKKKNLTPLKRATFNNMARLETHRYSRKVAPKATGERGHQTLLAQSKKSIPLIQHMSYIRQSVLSSSEVFQRMLLTYFRKINKNNR
ncbi:hypothetical protein Q7C36_021221 [Tachysurus vachellii]|uniref:Uncharacterized protein n=1 Tax=Tachysurus vachellii TaxID=175792 RepID=A0AA88LQK2_TACVA|nr:hypothetical protein Q7C36_021221 [Tachysurus vachellii]